ncbi:pyruvate dehydrogenase (acetyl-transferring) E1 component subunit alpha [Massilia terrae]|uniref:Pyruvate dehydrogenase E1 component subunit alpha n=1 Tax=Massilia terrae TaxID=1811224 RepID=A0ABT2CS04_9BURK|nr:pyruvate dehydrogenase (acetyl-transferring) E1 component subunit alpha [Massilia terrae]MCS0656760.1 pyruvate dehydrogenase (acetyl-transferring) E1 component subunit alpha [Massilia terrae]
MNPAEVALSTAWPASPPQERELCHVLLGNMQRIRRMEEKSAELYGAGKIRGFLHLYVGEEAVAVGALHALAPEDNIIATYREHGHALARGVPMTAIMAEMFGKLAGCSHGRGGSMHLFDRASHFYGGNAIVGSGIALAVGLALADKMQRVPRVSACFFGEGAMAEGVFHEAANLAALWKLPLMLICENNFYAMGTALARSESQTDLCTKAASYNMASSRVDGMDVLAVRQAVALASAQVRAGEGPYFLECQTYRFRAHSMFDPDLYRSPDEVEAWKKRDPINLFVARLQNEGKLTEEEFLALDASAKREIDAAVAFADAAAVEPVEDLTKDLLGEGNAP